MGSVPTLNPKVTMEFYYGQTGWSESLLYTSAVAVTNPTLYTDALALVTARASALDGTNAVVSLVKFSIENINRDVAYLSAEDLPRPTGGAYAGGPPSGATWIWQSPQLSWPVKFLDTNNNQVAIHYLAGMPATVNQTGPGPYMVSSGNSPGSFLVKYAKYVITSAKWGAAARTWPTAQFNAGNSTLGIAPPLYVAAGGAVPASLTFEFVPGGNTATVAPGSFVRVGGLKYNSPQNRLRLNGTYQVRSVTGNLIVVDAPRIRANPNFSTNGYYQAATYAVAPYVDYKIDNITHRKRGRVISSPRGRR